MENNLKAQPAQKEEKNKIDFTGIFKEAARILWKNRFLFWLGILMALGSPGSFNFSSQNDFGKSDSAQNFMQGHWQLIVILGLLAVAVGIIFFLLSLIGKAGAIKAVNLISRGQTSDFKSSWRSGKKYLGKMFGLFLVFFAASVLIILVLAVPVIFLAMNHSWVSAVIVGLLAVAILIPIFFVLAFTKIFAEYYIVLSNLRIWNSIELGYSLLVRNLTNALIFALLMLAVDIVLGIATIPIFGLAIVVLVPAGLLFFYLSKIAFGIYLALAILLFIVVVLAFSAIFNSYKTTAWTLFFREIAREKKPEAETVAQEEKIPDIPAVGEKV